MRFNTFQQRAELQTHCSCAIGIESFRTGLLTEMSAGQVEGALASDSETAKICWAICYEYAMSF